MKNRTFKVDLVRTASCFTTIEVEASNKEEAEALALDEAGDHEFNSEKEADYSVNSCVEIEHAKMKNLTVQKKDEIERILINMWASIAMDIPSNYEDIVQHCYEDVCETADPENWSDGDVTIAFRRWIESHDPS